MLHAGMGHSHVESFLSTVGVPVMHHKTMKRREREIAQHIGDVARKSCDAALPLEVEAMKSQPKTSTASVCDSDEVPECQFKYDMGWQKRGSGRAYDSSSGVGTLMGNLTGKIVAYNIRSKVCRICQHHSDSTPPVHDCQKNWVGSSKAMEADVAAEVVKKVQDSGVKVGTMIMDDDTTTISRIRKELGANIKKWSDLNHTKKHLGNSLYALAKLHTGLTSPIIQALLRWFAFAVTQNKNDVVGLRNALSQITPHAFGEHETCGKWCDYKSDPDSYYHKTLPHGRDLVGDSLKTDLESIFNLFCANAEKIAPAALTKEVESFNNMVASKAPKRCHYSGSESLRSRVDCAAAQKNLGHSYIQEVNISLGLSPGTVSKATATKRDRKRKQQSSLQNSREFKKRRLFRKMQKKLDTTAKETREGTTYQSCVDAKPENDENLEIPPPPPPLNSTINIDTFTHVIFDLETASFSRATDILQIAAVAGEHEFNQYVTPTGGIAPKASEVTGLTVHGGVLMLHGKPAPTIPILEALKLFIAWLHDIGHCLLIAHNARFDADRICHHIDACHLVIPFSEVVHGFVDSQPFLKASFPGLPNYKQETLVSSILGTTYDAHNALADVTALQKLVEKANITDNQLCTTAISVTFMFEKSKRVAAAQTNLETLQVLVSQKIISGQTANRISMSGLQLFHLQLAIQRGGFDGLRALLSEDVEGKPRVTKNKKILTKIHSFLS